MKKQILLLFLSLFISKSVFSALEGVSVLLAGGNQVSFVYPGKETDTTKQLMEWVFKNQHLNIVLGGPAETINDITLVIGGYNIPADDTQLKDTGGFDINRQIRGAFVNEKPKK
jgi:hypothetical protein